MQSLEEANEAFLPLGFQQGGAADLLDKSQGCQ